MCYSFVMARRPPLALFVLCRCDRVFWDYSSLFNGGASLFKILFFFLFFPSSAKCTFASVAWLWGTSHGVSLTNGIVKHRARDRRVFLTSRFSPRIRTDRCQNFNLSRFSFQNLSSSLYYQTCIHVWLWASAHVSNLFMCNVYGWECVHRLSEFQCFGDD